MANPQPVVCVFLKLPPEERIFFRIRDVSELFVHKVDQLTMVVAASPSANNSPVAVKAVQTLREDAAQHCSELSKAVYNAYKVATVYFDFVHNLSPLEVSEQTIVDIRSVYGDALLVTKKVEAARKAMTLFKQDIANVVTRIKEDLKEGKYSEDSTLVYLRTFTDLCSGDNSKEVFSPENGQTVSELLQAVDECDDLLRQVSDYHAEMMDQMEYQKEQEIRSNIPSEGEITLMRERWTHYLTTIRELKDIYTKIISDLLSAKEIKKAGGSGNNHSTGEPVPPTNGPKSSEIERRNLVLGTGESGPSRVEPKVSFWRSLLRNIYSCLTLKCFR